MRAWRTPSDTFIVECPHREPGPDYGPDYHEVDAAGAPVASYRAFGFSTQDSMGHTHHEVRGDALVEVYVEQPDRGEDRTGARVVRRGLVEVDARAHPALARACSDAIARRQEESERYWARSRAIQAARLHSPDQLPDLEGDALDFVLAHDGDSSVVVRCGERVVWSEPSEDWPLRRVDGIRDVFERKYGRRLRSFEGWYDVD